MKAAVLEAKHHPLIYQELPDPKAGPGEVVVKLVAAALNHRDIWIQKGLYAGLKFPIILGSDGAGLVHEVGPGVDESWLGRSVIINPGIDWGENPRAQGRQFQILGLPQDGTFAQLVKIPAKNLRPKPDYLSWNAAAALPLAGLTAYRALFARAKLLPQERVLITGIGGGVALFALQFALAAGATVFVSSSSDAKLDRAKSLGAHGGINYRQADWANRLREQVGGFEVIIDGAGGSGYADLIELAIPGGRIVSYGAHHGALDNFKLQRLFWKQLDMLGTTLGSAEDFAGMVSFAETHQIVPVLDQTFSLPEAEDAMRRMDAGDQFGKIVLTIDA
jgi:zinc-binding alcohol dehydrogenase/oxidoreductase